ncbi:hypothetical protein [Solemya velum gill symbiont]|uniref:hypothetical protein n=1 Tax=Solemya velum gill symbiont TaxID=2340 RepID=UPI000AB4FA30|nr:hypothetical protein [Solemya velum gill symbiont]
MNRPFQWLGRNLAEYLNTPITTHRPHYLVRPQEFMTILRPGDVLLVEGNTRISTAIKYLTQSLGHTQLSLSAIPWDRDLMQRVHPPWLRLISRKA